jgi:hypothetical protein
MCLVDLSSLPQAEHRQHTCSQSYAATGTSASSDLYIQAEHRQQALASTSLLLGMLAKLQQHSKETAATLQGTQQAQNCHYHCKQAQPTTGSRPTKSGGRNDALGIPKQLHVTLHQSGSTAATED